MTRNDIPQPRPYDDDPLSHDAAFLRGCAGCEGLRATRQGERCWNCGRVLPGPLSGLVPQPQPEQGLTEAQQCDIAMAQIDLMLATDADARHLERLLQAEQAAHATTRAQLAASQAALAEAEGVVKWLEAEADKDADGYIPGDFTTLAHLQAAGVKRHVAEVLAQALTKAQAQDGQQGGE